MSKVRTCPECGKEFTPARKSPAVFCGLRCRFEAKRGPADERGCRLFEGFKNPLGYGMFRVNPQESMRLAHRVAYTMFVGPIPAGLCVCHKCDNPACTTVDHFFLGTVGDNNADKMSKGRHRAVSGDDHPARRNPERWAGVGARSAATRAQRGSQARGETSGMSKLTEALVRSMRTRRASGESCPAIARSMNVSPNTVYRACARDSWRHIE